MAVTVQVALLSLFIAVALGMLGALAKLSKSRVAKAVAGVYTTIIRGVPDLVLMMLIFFGGQLLVNDISEALGLGYVDISPFIAGTLTIGFIFGAYMTETFRGGILAVSRGEIEAGYAFGMTGKQVFIRITLPAMVRHALPGFGNNWMVLAKATALVSVIGLQDLVYNANQAGGTTRQPFKFLLVAALMYLAITGISDLALRWAGRKYSVGVRRA
jgi:His/Glu/Gln/Arg/opine family amino acid ABC transporter permease subunit